MPGYVSRRLAAASLFIVLGVSVASAEFPERQVTLIVPFEAGGGSDRVARTVDQFWAENTGQGFVFQYQPGAAGAVGTDAVRRARKDGYTVGIVNMPNMVIQPVSGSAAFDLEDFDYIGKVNSDPIVLMVGADSPFETFDDFVAAAKESPNTLTLAITGTLGGAHLAALELMEGAGIEVTLVPTQGGANTIARIAGGHVSAGLVGLGLFTNQDNGRALAVTGTERSDFAPDVPTFAEFGIPLETETARVLIAPNDIPEDALSYLRENLRKVAESEGFKKASAASGQGAVWQSGEALEQEVLQMEADTRALLQEHGLIQ